MRPAAIRRRPAVLAALVAFVVGALVLGLTQHSTPLPIPRGQAIAVALKSPRVHRVLRKVRWDRVEADAVDRQLERLTFYEGSQAEAEVAIRRNGTVVEVLDFKVLAVPYGDRIAYEPGVLVFLAALFILMTAVSPWRRLRNLDVLLGLTLLAPVLLLQRHYIGASVIAALPGLLYLMGRCAVVSLGRARPTAPSKPVFDLLTPNWEAWRRIRLLRILLLVMALIFVLVTVSSIDAVDVLYAVMEGATKIVHGVLPYGHLPGDVIHGDTYPLLSYLFYVPLAWLSPVQSVWDSVDLALGVTVIAALGIAWAIFKAVVANNRGDRGSGQPGRELAGLRSALAWLAFPPVLVIVSSGTSDVVLGAMLVVALLLWRRPGLCTALLAAAAWFKLAPLALIPVRLAPLRGRRLMMALAGLAVVSVPMVGVLFALGGSSGPMVMLHAISFQFSRGSPQSVWAALGIRALQPVGEGVVLALIAAAVVRLRADPELGEDRQRMAALTVAILVGLQLVANYWAFLYLVWVFPLLGMSVLGEAADVAVPGEVGAAARQADLRPVGVAV
jgi:glycosyl transferase family 87